MQPESVPPPGGSVATNGRAGGTFGGLEEGGAVRSHGSVRASEDPADPADQDTLAAWFFLALAPSEKGEHDRTLALYRGTVKIQEGLKLGDELTASVHREADAVFVRLPSP